MPISSQSHFQSSQKDLPQPLNLSYIITCFFLECDKNRPFRTRAVWLWLHPLCRFSFNEAAFLCRVPAGRRSCAICPKKGGPSPIHSRKARPFRSPRQIQVLGKKQKSEPVSHWEDQVRISISWYRRRKSSEEEALIECIWRIRPTYGGYYGGSMGQ